MMKIKKLVDFNFYNYNIYMAGNYTTNYVTLVLLALSLIILFYMAAIKWLDAD